MYTRIFCGPDVECLPNHREAANDALCILPADQVLGTEPFKTSPAVQETLKQLKYISIDFDSFMQRGRFAKAKGAAAPAKK